MISDAETRALLKAIESKKKEIQLLENKLQKESSSENATFKGLSKRQKRWWKKHYKMNQQKLWNQPVEPQLAKECTFHLLLRVHT